MQLTQDHLRALALAQRNAEERTEDGITLFCVGPRIFAALVGEGEALLNLTPEQQAWVCAQSSGYTPDEGGRTRVNLSQVTLELLADFVTIAHGNVAPKGLSTLGELIGDGHV